MSKMCRSCGADFPPDAARCPFCGGAAEDVAIDKEAFLAERRKNFVPPQPKVRSGYLAKYARTVQDASHGAIV